MMLRGRTFQLNPASSPGVLELRRVLGERGVWAPAEIMGPVSALQEVRAVVESMLGGRGGPNQRNRPSLVIDIGMALGALGPETRVAAGVALEQFQKSLRELPRRLDRPQGARVVALALKPLLERLGEPATIQAAWRDTLNTFCDIGSTMQQCELRLMQLAELAELGGVDFDQRAEVLQAILSDDAAALHQLGALSTPPQPGQAYAGWSEQQRLNECEARVAVPAEVADLAVWLVIDEAALVNGYLALGPIQFFDQVLVPDEAQPGGSLEKRIDDYQPPAELAQWADVAAAFTDLPKVKHRLYARVWLPQTSQGEARRRASRVVQDVIDVANPNSDWVLLSGYASWNGRHWSRTGFVHPDHLRDRPVHAVFERTASSLEDFRGEYLTRLLAGEEVAREALDDALWAATLDRTPGLGQRVVLGIRSLERTLSQAQVSEGESWSVAAARYLQAPWVRFALAEQLELAGFAAYVGISITNPSLNLARSQVHEAVWVPVAPGKREFSVQGLAQEADFALQYLDPSSYDYRLVSDAQAVLGDPAIALQRLSDLEAAFDRLLARSERHRNAIVHGTRPSPQATATVDDFIRILARLVAQEAMRQAETGKEPLIEFERSRLRYLEAKGELHAGENPLDVLFD
jgi:hypothetical protein